MNRSQSIQTPVMINVHDLIADPPKVHHHQGQLITDWKLADEELLFLDGYLTEGMKTLETGAGVSTVVFAIKGRGGNAGLRKRTRSGRS